MRNSMGWLFLALALPGLAWSQWGDLDVMLEEQVIRGIWDSGEAQAIRAHVQWYGWPVIPEEAGAIEGLRPGTVRSLTHHPIWTQKCTSPKTVFLSKNQGLQVRYSTNAIIQPPQNGSWKEQVAARIRVENPGSWGWRVDRLPGIDHLQFSGFLQFHSHRGRVHHVWGDHIVRWGLGLTVWNASPFDGLRDPVSVLPVSTHLASVQGGPYAERRKGFAWHWKDAHWNLVYSMGGFVNQPSKNPPFETVAQLFRGEVPLGWNHALLLERHWSKIRLGLTTAIPFGLVDYGEQTTGLYAKGNRQNMRWAMEWMFGRAQTRGRAVGLWALGSRLDAFLDGSWEQQTGIISRTVGFGNVWKSPKDTWGRLWFRGDISFPMKTAGEATIKGSVEWRCKLPGHWKINGLYTQRQETGETFHEGLIRDSWRLRGEQTSEKGGVTVQLHLMPQAPGFQSWGHALQCGVRWNRSDWKCDLRVSDWRLQPGQKAYGSEMGVKGLRRTVLSGRGMRSSWSFTWKGWDGIECQWAGHRLERFDRLENGSGNQTTVGSVQTEWEFRLKVVL